MARRQVIEVTCDRCKRTETQSTDDDPDRRAKIGKELAITFHGQVFEYEDLCRRCRGAVENYFNKMTKSMEDEKSPEVKPSSPVSIAEAMEVFFTEILSQAIKSGKGIIPPDLDEALQKSLDSALESIGDASGVLKEGVEEPKEKTGILKEGTRSLFGKKEEENNQ